jgi:ribosomal-protein-alanine N-acetyltransferase
MCPEDIPAIAKIEESAFEDPWPDSAFEEMLESENRFNLVLVNGDGSLLGYLCAQCVADEVQIHNIAVDPSRQRQGAGGRLLQEAEAEGRRRGAWGAVLDVRSTNTAALALYGRFGYRRIGRRRNYYEHPRGDALVLFKPLLPETEMT